MIPKRAPEPVRLPEPALLRRSGEEGPRVVRPRRRRAWIEPGAAGVALGLALGALLWFSAAPDARREAVEPADAAGEVGSAGDASAPLPAVSAGPPARAGAPPIETAPPDSSLAASAPPAPEPIEADAIWVQLVATHSDVEAGREWERLRGRYEDLLASFEPRVVRVARDGGGEFHRLRVGPFASRGTAGALCDSLRARGASCFVAAPSP